MISIISLFAFRPLLPFNMNDNKITSGSGVAFIGSGEFQLKDVYVVADVIVKNGIVSNIDFTSDVKEVIKEADQIVDLLKGKQLSQALDVKAKEADSVPEDHSESVVRVALFEAFHRAVETCLDDE